MKLFDDTPYIDYSVMTQRTHRQFHAVGKERYGAKAWDEERLKLVRRRFGLDSSTQLSDEQALRLIEEFMRFLKEMEAVGLTDSIIITSRTTNQGDSIMAFEAGLVNSVDQSTVENDGPAYPVIQWVNGSPANRPLDDISFTGGWFMSNENCELQGPEDPFSIWAMMHRTGEQTLGYGAEGLHFSVLQTRNRWEVYEESGQRKVFAWNGYDTAKQYGRPSGRLHMLVVVKGLEKYGPHIVTLRGMTGAAITKRNGILHQYADKVLKAANMASLEHSKANGTEAKRWPRRLFWMPLSSQRKQGSWEEPVFSTVGQGQNTSQITYPALVGVPQSFEEVDLNKYFVGADLMDSLTDLQTETEAWSHEWDSLEAGITAAEADGYAEKQDEGQKASGQKQEEQFGSFGQPQEPPPGYNEDEEIPF